MKKESTIIQYYYNVLPRVKTETSGIDFFDGFSFMFSYLLSSKFEFQQLSKPFEHCDLSTLTILVNCIKVYQSLSEILPTSEEISEQFDEILQNLLPSVYGRNCF